MPTILVVDDDAVHRELASRCLRPLRNLRILHAENGEEAMRAIANEAPDLVLTDLLMPGMDGLALVKKLHQDYPHLPTILMTSFGSEETVVQVLTAGAASYVSKKDLKDTILETVEQVLEVAGARKRRDQIFKYLETTDSRFELANDPELIPALVGYFQDNLLRLGFGDEVMRTQMGMALMEAVSNAMFHGNLEVSSDLRDGPDSFHGLIEERRKEPPYNGRRVHVTASESRAQVVYVVRDHGPGFDPAKLPDPIAPENMVRVCGRGLLLIRTFMDRVEHNEKGNEIRMWKLNPQEAAGLAS